MGNYEELKQAVSDVIKTNGNQEITGAIMQNALLTIISTVGANSTFAGIATPSTNPGTPDQNIFYIASLNGVYSNFNGTTLKNEVVVFVNKNGNWESINTGISPMLNFDDTPTLNSDNPVKSNGIRKALDEQKNEVNNAKDEALQAINKHEQEAITNFNEQRVTPEMLSESVLQLIQTSGGGTINNFADDEDITTKDNGLGVNVLKFADRNYNPANYSGKGYVILRKNIIGSINALTQEMLNKEQTIYEIRYEYDLQEEEILIPKGCVLKFNGGKLKNGIINCDDTIIQGCNYIFNNIILKGNTKTKDYNCIWWGVNCENADNKENIDDAIKAIQNIGGNLIFSEGIYKTSGSHIIENVSERVTNILGSGSINLGTKIQHIGNDYVFWFRRGDNGSLFSGAKIDGICILGNENTTFGVRFSDSWGYTISNCFISGISNGIGINVYNYISWTENAIIENVMIRGTKFGVTFSKSDNESATSSAFSSIIKNLSISFTVGNDRGIYVDGISCYGCYWDDIKVWYEAGGGHTAIYAVNNSQIYGYIRIESDGDAGQDTNIDLLLCKSDDSSYIEVEGIATMGFASRIGNTGVSSKNTLRRVVQPTTAWRHNDMIPNVYFKGACVSGGEKNVSHSKGDIMYDSRFLSPFTNYELNIRYNNKSYYYNIYIGDGNMAAIIEEQFTITNTITNDGEITYSLPFRVIPPNDEFEGGFVLNGGLRFNIVSTKDIDNITWYFKLTQL